MPGPSVPPVKVATWNLWWRFGPWEARQPAIVETLRQADADLVCLQEVWAEEDGPDQAADLAAALGLHHVRSSTPFRAGVAFGNTVGWRPVSSW